MLVWSNLHVTFTFEMSFICRPVCRQEHAWDLLSIFLIRGWLFSGLLLTACDVFVCMLFSLCKALASWKDVLHVYSLVEFTVSRTGGYCGTICSGQGKHQAKAQGWCEQDC